ncbi:hypothetical protein [unidentified bacterial endosymbiont]|uniref:hypothetical protein n=1 Tax=unidentified bacterial endosymbiont TaxID=2355 RepID=UPI00209C710F|nr:hypothetical protein [unidentified bacterial endosymbiont]
MEQTSVNLKPNTQQLAYLPIEYRKLNPLSSAVLNADYDEISRLIKLGACVNKINDYKITPLMVAGFKNDKRALDTLLNYNANPFLTDVFNQTVLDIITNNEIKKDMRSKINNLEPNIKNSASNIKVNGTDEYKELSAL